MEPWEHVLLPGTIVNRTKYCRKKWGNVPGIGVRAYRWSYLPWSPVIVTYHADCMSPTPGNMTCGP